MMKTMPRILLLLFVLSVTTLVFIARCALYIDSQLNQHGEMESLYTGPAEKQETAKFEKDYQQKIYTLQRQIQFLEETLRRSVEHGKNLTMQINQQASTERTLSYLWPERDLDQEQVEYFQEKLQSAEVLHGVSLNTEYEVIAFEKFTINRIYLINPGLGKRVIEKPIGFKKKDLMEVITFAVEQLNKGRQEKQKVFTVDDFIEGIYRTEPTSGSHYEMFFRNIDIHTGYSYSKVIVMRPFGPVHLITSSTVNTSHEWINLILPLSGRVDSFRQFMSRFVKACILQDKRVYLTVVYFGKEGQKEVKDIMSKIAKDHQYKKLKLVTLNEKFSRGRGLQVGALNWKGGDILMFLCDVDIVFTAEFLERCRLNTDRSKRVYYPIVFSLYNPKVVYSLQDRVIPPEREQLNIGRDTGFWRDFGYGMTCQYRSDFLKLKGFDEHITGWGGEDVSLYQKYVRSDYLVIRATDPGLFHLWHEKHCDPTLSMDQYRSCIRSRALNEASHAQLGLLAFKHEVDVHRSSIQQKPGLT